MLCLLAVQLKVCTHAQERATTSLDLPGKFTDGPGACYVEFPSMCISSAHTVAQCRITRERQDASTFFCGAVPCKLHCREMNSPRHLQILDSKATHPTPHMCSSGGYGLIAPGIRTTNPTRSFTHSCIFVFCHLYFGLPFSSHTATVNVGNRLQRLIYFPNTLLHGFAAPQWPRNNSNKLGNSNRFP